MGEKHLHIVSFAIPFPPDYGGVIDVFYKIKALHELGVKVHLHCFLYERDEAPELEEICESVNYYPRGSFYKGFYSYVPYIVGSREAGDLLSNLVHDDYPILFEGLHTCFYLEHPSLKDRVKAVRMHNIEWDYYRNLGKAERSFFRKFYYYAESMKLKKFEPILKHATHIFAISPMDQEYLQKSYNSVTYLPAFHRNSEISSPTGKGNYAIYHGNLGVVENNQAAIYLVQKVFKNLDIPLIIAGKNPLGSLKKIVSYYDDVELRENLTFDVMLDLISNAHVNVLVTFQQTGIKLKLINSLYNGRFCLVNSKMVDSTGLDGLCGIADDAEEMQKKIKDLLDKEFTQEDIEKRQLTLSKYFSNIGNAAKIIEQLYSPHQSLSHSHNE